MLPFKERRLKRAATRHNTFDKRRLHARLPERHRAQSGATTRYVYRPNSTLHLGHC